MLEEAHHGVLLEHRCIHEVLLLGEPLMLYELVELRTLGWVFREHQLDDGQAGICHIVSIDRQGQSLVNYGVFNFLEGLSIEGEASEQELIEENSERPNIETLVCLVALAAQQLRRRVSQRALGVLLVLILEGTSDSKVNDDQAAVEAVSLPQHYVLKFDVSVHESPLVAVVESMANLVHHHLGFSLRQFPSVRLQVVS